MADRINSTVLFGVVGIIVGVGMVSDAWDARNHHSVWLTGAVIVVGFLLGMFGNSILNKGINEEVDKSIQEYKLKRFSK